MNAACKSASLFGYAGYLPNRSQKVKFSLSAVLKL